MKNKHKICVLDGYSVNPGDLDWKPISTLGDFFLHDRTSPEQLIERAQGMDALLLNKVVIRKKHLDLLPNLKYIGILATGYNNVDVEEAAKRGIIVTNVPSYSTASVAQMVFAHLLNICVRIPDYAASVKQGCWSECPDFSYLICPIHELKDKTMGIVGLGNIGMAVAGIAKAFGMNVAAHTSKTELPPWITKCTLDELFANADVLSLHCPLNEATKNMVNARRLSLMKPSAVLINTGRGGLIDEHELALALNEGRLHAAALDVLSVEPPPSTNPLLSAKNCYITPHVAWATTEARARLMQIAAMNLAQFINGREISNRVV